MHYQRVLATGNPGPLESHKAPYGSRGEPCSIEGCRRPIRAGLLCEMHYSRQRIKGSVGGLTSLRREMPPDSRKWTLSERHRYYKYGLTPDAFNALLAKQAGRCYICGTTEPNGKGWSVDHCHDTNVVRFIACNPCNVAFGFIREDPVIAQRLLEVCLEWQAAKAVANA
jgi:hypothetical protein